MTVRNWPRAGGETVGGDEGYVKARRWRPSEGRSRCPGRRDAQTVPLDVLGEELVELGADDAPGVEMTCR